LWLGALGCALVGGWFLTRFPDARDSPDLPNQPVPSALWQVGVVLAIIGAIAVTAGFLLSPALGSAPAEPVSTAMERVFVVGLLAAIGIGAIASSMAAAAASNEYAWKPLLVVPLVAGAAIWSWVA
jgi:hypothetical protein